MKFTVLFLVLGILEVSGKGTAQTITLAVKDAPLKLVMREIKKQTGYSFIYGKEQLEGTRKITLDVRDIPLTTALGIIFKDQPITYVITEKYIALTQRVAAPADRRDELPVVLTDIRGRVQNDKGEPLAGATVAVKGTNSITQTDGNGEFDISTAVGKGTLIITNVGYEPGEVRFSGTASVGNVILNLLNEKLDQVVLTGYSSQRKKDITGSVAVVNVKDFKEVPGGTPENLLQGRAAGLTVINAGLPGGNSILRIRGITSFGGADPLVIIDGTRGSIHDINPNDIQDISVLKDAGAAAIYGVSGSAGVILVTTKKGKAGKTTFSYDGYFGAQQPLQGNVFHLLNTQEMADLQWTAFKNSGQTPSSPQYGSGATPVIPDYVMIGPTQFGVSREPTQAELDAYNIDWTKGPINQIVKANKQGTDWFHEMFKPGHIQSHTITASGGSDKSTYLLSLNYFDNKGTLLNTYLKRYALRANTVFSNASKSIRFGENLYIFYKENPQQFSSDGKQGEGDAIFGAYRMQPILPMYDINGGFAGNKPSGVGDDGNQVASLIRNKNIHAFTLGLQGNVFAEVDFLRHFLVRTQFGGFSNYNYNYGLGVRSYENSDSGPNNEYTESSGFQRQGVWTNTLSYSNSFGKHNLKVLGGVEALGNYSRSLFGLKLNYFVDNPDYANLSTGSATGQQSSSGGEASTLFSYFGQLDYAYNDKYLLGVRFRRDGSSIFGPLNRWGNFPSASLGWRIGREDFMQTVTWVNDLKLRGSWGKLGSLSNTNLNNQYNLFGGGFGDSYYDISGTTTSTVQGFRQTRIGNPNTGWEEDIITNAGLDATLFDSKVDLTVEWFKKKISGLLFDDQSHFYGVGNATLPKVNIGDIQNQGIDASLVYHTRIAESVKFNVGLLFTKYKSRVVDIPGEADYFGAGTLRIGDPAVRNEEGHPIGAFYGYKVIGLFQNADEVAKAPTQSQAAPGRFRYLDANGDGKISDSDRTFIGDPNPKFTYGLNLSASYKNFDISMFMYGSYGNDLFNYEKYWTDFYTTFAGVKSKDLLYNSWTPDRPNAKTPIAENVTTFSTNGATNSYYVEKGSYLRCKSLVLGYQVPAALLNNVKISSLRIYFQVANLFTITKYSGLDPEIGGNNSSDPNASFGIDYGSYPNNEKSFLVGVNLSF